MNILMLAVLLPVCLQPGGDLNLDGCTDSLDLAIVLSAYGSATPVADLNSDGRVDDGDLNLLLADWGCHSFEPLPIFVHEPWNIARAKQPVRLGIPIPRGALHDTAGLAVYTSGHEQVAADFTVLARWGDSPDGTRSIAVVLCDFIVSLEPGATKTFYLEHNLPLRTDPPGISINEQSACYIVDTGPARFTVAKNDLSLLSSVEVGGEFLLEGPGQFALNGLSISATEVETEVVKGGGQRATLRLSGHVAGTCLDVTVLLHFYYLMPVVDVQCRVENNELLLLQDDGQPHANNLCPADTCYGDDLYYQAPFTFNALSFRLPCHSEAAMQYTLAGAGGFVSGPFTNSVRLAQWSSGTEQWDVYPGLPDYACRQQYHAGPRDAQIRVDGSAISGPHQSPGWLHIQGSAGAVFASVADFWQNFPKTLSCNGAGILEIGLFPGDYPADHVLRTGEYKTHRFFLAFGPTLNPSDYLGLNRPPAARNPSQWYTRSAFLGPCGPSLDDGLAVLEEYLGYCLDTSPHQSPGDWEYDNLYDALQSFDVYGSTDYGDLPTDFENGRSPYNLKYEYVRGLIYQFLRAGDARWWHLGRAAVTHFCDMDIQHSPMRDMNDPARQWPHGGTYGHGYHDEPAFANPHRNCMNPCMGYTFGASGAFLYYLLTGDRLVLDSALEVAANYHWRLRHTAGQEPVTDCVVCEGWADWLPSRETADPISVFLWAYKCTGRPEYLAILQDGMVFQNTLEQAPQPPEFWSDRLHMQALNARSIGEYLVHLQTLGQSDAHALAILQRRCDYLVDPDVFHMDGGFAELHYTYDGTPMSMHDNWLLAAADALAARALLENNADLLNDYAVPLAYTAAVDPWYAGDSHHYHYSHVTVNAVGYGHMLRRAVYLLSNP